MCTPFGSNFCSICFHSLGFLSCRCKITFLKIINISEWLKFPLNFKNCFFLPRCSFLVFRAIVTSLGQHLGNRRFQFTPFFRTRTLKRSNICVRLWPITSQKYGFTFIKHAFHVVSQNSIVFEDHVNVHVFQVSHGLTID